MGQYDQQFKTDIGIFLDIPYINTTFAPFILTGLFLW